MSIEGLEREILLLTEHQRAALAARFWIPFPAFCPTTMTTLQRLSGAMPRWIVILAQA